MILILLLFLLSVLNGVCEDSYPYSPTPVEIARALHFQKPMSGWGYQARQEKDLRIMIIGGSNSAGYCYSDYMTNVLQNRTRHPSYKVEVLKHVISGCAPYHYFGLRYDFEDDPTDTWPNVFMLEFTINYFDDNSVKNVAPDTDAVIQNIRFRYKHHNVSVPDFVFLELFSMEKHVSRFMEIEGFDRLASLANHTLFGVGWQARTNGHERGCPGCKEFREVASFYGYPTISFREMAFPAFVRYYLNTPGKYKDNPWKYSQEGSHLTPVGGELLVDTLMVPFFSDAMTPRVELPVEQRTMYGGVEVRMFPATMKPYQILNLATFKYDSIFGTGNSIGTLYKALRKPLEYHHMKRKDDGHGKLTGNECYGSNNRSASIHIDFDLPSLCDTLGNCVVYIEFIHSWNETHYGMAKCTLNKVEGSAATPRFIDSQYINVTLDSGKNPMKHTAPMTTRFGGGLLKQGKYSVSCNKLDDKLTCLSGLIVAGGILL